MDEGERHLPVVEYSRGVEPLLTSPDVQSLPGLGLDRSPFWKGVARLCAWVFWWVALRLGVWMIVVTVSFIWRNWSTLFP